MEMKTRIYGLLLFVIACVGEEVKPPEISSLTSTSVDAGEYITLACHLTTKTSYSISWNWYCDGSSMSSYFINSVQNQSTLRFKTSARYDQTYCNCRARSYSQFDKSSNLQLITVYHVPSSSPSIQWKSTSSYSSYSSTVKEGESVVLQCSLSSSGNPPVTWSWFCGNNVIVTGITSKGKVSEMKLQTEEKHDSKLCYCKATTSRSTLSYDRTSSRKKLQIYYIPKTSPKLSVVTSTSVDNGKYITLMCTLPTPGNPVIDWYWYCNGNSMSYRYVTSVENQTTLRFKAIQSYDQTECHCRAKSSKKYDSNSVPEKITVFHAPSTYPQITSLTTLPVTEGSPVTLRCTLSQLGNPPIKWSWACDDSDITDGVSNAGKTSELVLVADSRFKQIFCSCRASSGSLRFGYNKTSLKKLITVKELDNACESASTTEYHAVIGVMGTLLVSCLVVIVVLVLKILRRGLCFGKGKDDSRIKNIKYNADGEFYEIIQRQTNSKDKKENSIEVYENTTMK